jgi:hypothetical protein
MIDKQLSPRGHTINPDRGKKGADGEGGGFHLKELPVNTGGGPLVQPFGATLADQRIVS